MFIFNLLYHKAPRSVYWIAQYAEACVFPIPNINKTQQN